jgi:hypothetical protein
MALLRAQPNNGVVLSNPRNHKHIRKLLYSTDYITQIKWKLTFCSIHKHHQAQGIEFRTPVSDEIGMSPAMPHFVAK